MKKTLVIVLALALVLAASALTLTACSPVEYEGEYSYYAWDYANWSTSKTHQYGCKVVVAIQGGVITNVSVLEDTDEYYNVSAGWTSAYGSEYGVDTEGKTNWRLHGQEMADSFVGLTTDEVLKIKVYVASDNYTRGDVIPKGQPLTVAGIETIKYLPEQVKAVIGQYGNFGFNAGATQSSARLVLAIQDAILKSKGLDSNPNCVEFDIAKLLDEIVTLEGEYCYENAWTPGQYYGAKVKVTLTNGVISAISIEKDTDNYYNLSAGWKDKQLWIDGGDAMVQSFVGLTPDEVMAITVDCAANGQPNSISGAPAGLKVVAGATQSSGRLILAVQNALGANNKIATAIGEIKADGLRADTNYQVKVSVTVMGDVITAIKLLELDEGYVYSTPRWDPEGTKTAGLQAFLDEQIVGQTIADVLAWEVDASKTGAGALISGAKFAGATETGARAIAAVQNALEQLAK